MFKEVKMKKRSSHDYASWIAPRLRLLRSKLGYTQDAMAGRVGVSPGGYKKYEVGQRLLSLSVQYRMVKEFNVSLDWLLLGKGPMYSSDKQPNQDLEQEVQRLNGKLLEMERQAQESREAYKKEMWELMDAMNRDEVLYYEIMAHFKRYHRGAGAPD
jgi:transcriptional regulator with XRE-family HTH domain